MDQTTYVRWWQLHLRVAKGDELDAAERATYEAGLIELDAEEKAQWTDNDLTRLRRLKAEVESLQATRAQLQAQSRRLDRQIRTLEGPFVALTGIELSGLRISQERRAMGSPVPGKRPGRAGRNEGEGRSQANRATL